MKLPIYSFLFIFGMPMLAIMWNLPPATLERVAEESGTALALFALALFAPRILRALFVRQRARRPSARALATLRWPARLSPAEMETFCLAWLRGRGWAASYAADEGDAVYLSAARGPLLVALACDTQAEMLNPAAMRAFAEAAARMKATHAAVVTQRAEVPNPARVAAQAVGVRILRVADLAQLDALAAAEAA